MVPSYFFVVFAHSGRQTGWLAGWSLHAFLFALKNVFSDFFVDFCELERRDIAFRARHASLQKRSNEHMRECVCTEYSRMVKHHCMAGIQFYWFGFDRFATHK